MKKIVFLIIALVLASAFFTVGCVKKDNDKEKSGELAKQETYPALMGSLQTVYDSFDEMKKDAACIALVEINDRRIETTETLPMTYTSVSVKEVYKGELKPDDVIEVIEEGGFTDEILLGDYPQLKKGSQYVLFMLHTEGNYYICGAFQGRFILRDGFVVQQRTEDVGLKDYSPVTLEEFKKLILK